jgi:hypothetical protein
MKTPISNMEKGANNFGQTTLDDAFVSSRLRLFRHKARGKVKL